MEEAKERGQAHAYNEVALLRSPRPFLTLQLQHPKREKREEKTMTADPSDICLHDPLQARSRSRRPESSSPSSNPPSFPSSLPPSPQPPPVPLSARKRIYTDEGRGGTRMERIERRFGRGWSKEEVWQEKESDRRPSPCQNPFSPSRERKRSLYFFGVKREK